MIKTKEDAIEEIGAYKPWIAPRYGICITVATLLTLIVSCSPSVESEKGDSVYLQAVQEFADHILDHGRDRYGDVHSPLFADGIHVETGEPMRWEYDGQSWVISNFASQQNLMRVLTSLTELTGKQRYRDEAEKAARYMFTNHTDSQGLLYWGGHQFVDLMTMEHQFEGRPHELKNNFPYYEFLWEVDAEATQRMLEAIWNAHIMDWDVLDINRHGEYNSEPGHLWDHEFEQQDPFFEGRGLTFINFGTDMIQTAMTLHFLANDDDARDWGVRLYEQFVRARHPETGLGVYQYSRPERRSVPPEDGPLEGTLTYSHYGDRAENQFGEIYGDIALEGNALWGSRISTLYGRSPIMLFHLAEQLKGTQAGDDMLNWTLDGLKALAQYSYVPESNHFRPMWTDGTDLTGQVIQRTGYFGKEGDEFKPYTPDGTLALSFSKAIRLSEGDPELWNVIRHILIGEGLGDPGMNPTDKPDLNLQTANSNPDLLVTLLELNKITGSTEYVRLAERIGDNILEKHFHNGYFMPSENHVYSRFDDPETHALLLLDATLQGKPEFVPPYLTGRGGTQGEHDDIGRTRDWIFYDQTY